MTANDAHSTAHADASQTDVADDFPVGALPPVCRDVVAEMTRTIQAPPSICAASILTVSSLAAQALADIELPSVGKAPTSLFFLTVAKTGERKSATDKAALRVVNDVEAEMLAAETDPQPLLYSDLTIEGLDWAFGEGARSLGLVNDDGGEVTSGRQASSDEGKARFLAGISRAWDAAPRKSLRKGSGRTMVVGKRLTTHLMIQPVLAKSLLSDTIWAQQGALPRFMVSWPQSRIGTRPLRECSSEGERAFQAFRERIAGLLRTTHPTAANDESVLAPPAIGLTSEAQRRWTNFYHEIEFQLDEDGPLGHIQGFGAKLPEHAARLAGVFAVIEDGSSTTVTDDQMDRAIQVARHYLAELLTLQSAASGQALRRSAQTLDTWLNTRTESEISFSELLRFGPGSLRQKEKLAPVVQQLVADGRLVRIEGGTVRNGRRRRDVYRIVSSSNEAA